MKIIILLVLCLSLHIELYPSRLTSFPNSGTEEKNPNPELLISQAVEAFYNGQYLEVIRLSRKALFELNQIPSPNELNRHRIGACYDNIGQSYHYLGLIDSADWNYQNAVQVMGNLTSYSKNDVYPTFQRYAYLKINLGQYEEAIHLLEQILGEHSVEEVSKIEKEPYENLSLGTEAEERKADYNYDGACEDILESMLFYPVENSTRRGKVVWNNEIENFATLYIQTLIHLAQSYIGLEQPEMAKRYTYLSILLYQNLKYYLHANVAEKKHEDYLWPRYDLYALVVQYRKTFGIKPTDYFLAYFDNEELLKVLNEYEDNTPHYQPFFDLLTNYIEYLLQWDEYENASGLLNTYMPKYKHANDFYLSKLFFLDAKRMLKSEHSLANGYPHLASGQGKNELEIYRQVNNRFKESIRSAMDYYEGNQYALSLDEQKRFWENTYQLIQTYYGSLVDNVLKKDDWSPHLKSEFLASIIEIQALTKGKSLSNALNLKRAIYSSDNDSLRLSYQNLIKLREKFSAGIIKGEEDDDNQNMLDNLQSAIKASEIRMMRHVKSPTGKEIDVTSIQEALSEKDAYVEIVKLNYLSTEKKFKYYENYTKPVGFTGQSGNNQMSYGRNVYEYNTKKANKYLVVIVRKDNICHRILEGENLEARAIKYYQNMIRFRKLDMLSYSKFYQNIVEGDQKDFMSFSYTMSGKKHYYIPENFTLKGCETIYYCPDGVYNIVNPVSLFNTQTKEYLNKDFNFVLISSPNYFSDDDDVTLTEKEAVLFGNPTFHQGKLSPDTVGVKERAILGLFNGSVSSLPGTEIEVNSISSILAKNFKTSTYKMHHATEANLRKITPPYLLHIATHGFYMKTEDGSPLEQMSNSGLLFTGFMAGNDQYTDGVFSSQEASSLNLKGTRLVILSACQTGLGEIQNGDGVYGLQMGFSIAGAKNIIQSLWSIDDAATAQWMHTFYSYYAEDQNIEKAYNRTVYDLQKKYVNPYFWGAFVLLKN